MAENNDAVQSYGLLTNVLQNPLLPPRLGWEMVRDFPVDVSKMPEEKAAEWKHWKNAVSCAHTLLDKKRTKDDISDAFIEHVIPNTPTENVCLSMKIFVIHQIKGAFIVLHGGKADEDKWNAFIKYCHEKSG